MGTPRLFRFYLLDGNGNYYQKDSQGNIVLTPTKTRLQNSPANWDQIKIQYGRNEKWFGVFRKSTAPLEFVLDGRDILRAIYYKDGQANFNAYCKLVIEKRNDYDHPSDHYLKYYEAEIDFANGIDDGVNETGDYFKVNLLEKGLTEILNTNANTPYPLDFDADSELVYNDGLPIRATYKWITGDLDSFNIGGDREWIFPLGSYTDESAQYFKNFIYPSNQNHEVIIAGGGTTPTPNDNNRFLWTGIPIVDADFTLTATMTVTAGNYSGPVNFGLRLLKKDIRNNQNAFFTLFSDTFAGNQTKTLNISIADQLDFDAYDFGYYLVLTFNTGGQATQTSSINIAQLDMAIQVSEPLPATDTKTFSYPKFVQKHFAKMAPGYGVISSFLNLNKDITELPYNGYYNNIPSYTRLTSGDALRGISTAQIETTLDDLFQDMYSRWMVGMGIEGNNLRIEQLPYFFQQGNVIATLKEINKFRKSTATDFLFNQMKVGYQNQDLDKVNGRAEANSELTYKLPITRINKEQDLTSPYRADIYGIEYIRSDYFGKDTTDSAADKSVFLLEAYPFLTGGKHLLVRYSSTPYQRVFGVQYAENVFNVGLAPMYFPLRHISYLRSILNIKQGIQPLKGKVTFQTGAKNNDFATYIAADYHQQSDDIYVGAQKYYNPSKLFIPLIFEFEAQPPFNLLELCEANPYGEIAFKHEGNTYYGFILDVGITPGTEDVYEFRLLCSPSTDTTLLM